MYNDIAQEHLKKKKVKIRNKSLPWINSSIRKLMNKRYKQLRKAQTSNLPDDWKEYRKLRNEVNKKLKNAESKYYLEMLESKRNGSKEFWNLIKKITKREVTKRLDQLKAKKEDCYI